jgi:ATP-dependent DNA helicase RecG
LKKENTLKIINSCRDAGLPEPDIVEFNGGLLVTVFKNKYSIEQLQKSGLNERQIKAVQYVLKMGKITNKEYQKINNVSKATATRDLNQLYETHKILIKTGSTGAGTEYTF